MTQVVVGAWLPPDRAGQHSTGFAVTAICADWPRNPPADVLERGCALLQVVSRDFMLASLRAR